MVWSSANLRIMNSHLRFFEKLHPVDTTDENSILQMYDVQVCNLVTVVEETP